MGRLLPQGSSPGRAVTWGSWAGALGEGGRQLLTAGQGLCHVVLDGPEKSAGLDPVPHLKP